MPIAQPKTVRVAPPKKERPVIKVGGLIMPTPLEIEEGAALIAFIKRPLDQATSKRYITLTCRLLTEENTIVISRCPECGVARVANDGDCRHCGAGRAEVGMTARDFMSEQMRADVAEQFKPLRITPRSEGSE